MQLNQKPTVKILADANRESSNKKRRMIKRKKDVEKSILEIKKIRKEMEEVKREIYYLEAELENRKNALEDKKETIRDIENSVRNYGEKLRSKYPTKKTFYFKNGKLRFGKRQRKWDYPDEERFVKTCEDSGLTDVIQNRKRVHKTKFKNIVEVKDDGRVINPETKEIIKGVRTKKRSDYFRIYSK